MVVFLFIRAVAVRRLLCCGWLRVLDARHDADAVVSASSDAREETAYTLCFVSPG
jgi:hypothetical protein